MNEMSDVAVNANSIDLFNIKHLIFIQYGFVCLDQVLPPNVYPVNFVEGMIKP